MNLFPKLLSYFKTRYAKPEGEDDPLPIDSLLRIDMTCGLVSCRFLTKQLRPKDEKQYRELIETCRYLHEMLDTNGLVLKEYLDWFEQSDRNPRRFTDILARHLFSEFIEEKMEGRKTFGKWVKTRRAATL
jgi:hypothetical protein